VVLNQPQIDSIGPRVLMDDDLYNDLSNWIKTHYRDRLTFEDLQDPQLFEELKAAASSLEPILRIENIYPM
jgi:succinylarginine dihydrolase